jgi:hypothetical protein
MLRGISSQVTSDRRESSPAETIETIRQLHLQRMLRRILVNFPLPERRRKLEAAK